MRAPATFVVPWIDADTPPDVGKRVIVFGVRLAPDGPHEVDLDIYQGRGAWARFDAVSHWLPLDWLPLPEEEA